MQAKIDPPLPNWQCKNCGFSDIIHEKKYNKCPICGSKNVVKIILRKKVTAAEKRLVSFC